MVCLLLPVVEPYALGGQCVAGVGQFVAALADAQGALHPEGLVDIINRDAIGITQTKYIEIGNLTTQVLGTGKVS